MHDSPPIPLFSPQPAADAPSVLVCDDVAALRELLVACLTATGELRVVGEAADGLECVERLEELEPDAVLLDLAMPRLDGLEAIGRLRIADPDVAIVVLSGFGSTRLAPAARRLGADSYIEKGRPLAEIREEVLRAIASRATSAGRTRAQR